MFLFQWRIYGNVQADVNILQAKKREKNPALFAQETKKAYGSPQTLKLTVLFGRRPDKRATRKMSTRYQFIPIRADVKFFSRTFLILSTLFEDWGIFLRFLLIGGGLFFWFLEGFATV